MNYEIEQRECSWCKLVFFRDRRLPYDIWVKKRFCSDVCKKMAQAVGIEKGLVKRKVNSKFKICPYCHCGFVKGKHVSNKYWREEKQYCSNECKTLAKNGELSMDREDILKRIFSRSHRQATGCMMFKGYIVRGFGVVEIGGVLDTLPRQVYKLVNGLILANQNVYHSCGNNICINPDHLYLGDMKFEKNDEESVRVKLRKGYYLNR